VAKPASCAAQCQNALRGAAQGRWHQSMHAGAPRSVGEVAVAGNYSSAQVHASGTGSVYVSGVTDSVAANMGGIGNLFVEAANRARLPCCAPPRHGPGAARWRVSVNNKQL